MSPSFLYQLVLLLQLMVGTEAANFSRGSSLVASDDSSNSFRESPSGELAFGFRRINDQSMFLFAIWYSKIPERTIAWYANGDNPAPKGSKLELTKDGQFTLTGPKGQQLWPESVFDDISYAAILDTGNLVLARGSTHVWESFKNPCDSLLPTQLIEIGGKLTSRQADTSYAEGRFQLSLKRDGDVVLSQLALPTGNEYASYYRTGTSNSSDEMGSGYQLHFNQSGYLNVVLRNGKLVSLTNKTTVPAGNFYYMAIIEPFGIFSLYAHPKEGTRWSQGVWSLVWSVPNDVCFAVNGDLGGGPCGYNSYCRLDANRKPICECLPGFSPLDPVNMFNGCKLDKQHKCEMGSSSSSSTLKLEDKYVMQELSNTYWPTNANYEKIQPSNEEDCTRSCLYDCNCVVAVIKEGSCWKKKLPVSSGRQDCNAYGKAIIKLPKSDISSGETLSGDSNMSKKDQTTLVLVGALLLGTSVFLNFLLVAAMSLFLFHTNQKRHKTRDPFNLLETNLRTFTYEDLKEATDGFREQLGRGAFGTVYKGVMSLSSSRIYVAVKRLDRVVQEGENEFRTEASAIAKTHHKNLVRLLGFCDEGQNKLLVYEFMSNGTLASFLFGISRPDWNKRVQMVSGIARGLMYLHEECSTQIIHCDIKPQNILLDDTFMARISDFGLAKLLLSDQTRTQTMIRGTRGYVAPEWFRNTPITAKVDVYSYGVLLLEVICCRKSLEMERENEEEVILTDWAFDCYIGRRLYKLVEDDDEASSDMKRLERLVMVALWCIQEDPSLRPSMKKVIQMLEGVVAVSDPPCPSIFCHSTNSTAKYI